MKVKETTILEKLAEAAEPAELTELGRAFNGAGYSLFHELIDNLKFKLAASDESGVKEVKELLRKGRIAIPEPGAISPSWKYVWDEYDQIVRYKEEALRAVPADNRSGEWQIVMDNPLSNEGIACYPTLSFVEAAYLYGYFRKDLKKNEYLRLQKIVNLLIVEGS